MWWTGCGEVLRDWAWQGLISHLALKYFEVNGWEEGGLSFKTCRRAAEVPVGLTGNKGPRDEGTCIAVGSDAQDEMGRSFGFTAWLRGFNEVLLVKGQRRGPQAPACLLVGL